MNQGKIVIGLLAGFAAGALIGVLFAPEKGSVTRRKISKKGEDYIDDLKENMNDLLEEVKQEVDTVKAKVNEFTGNGKLQKQQTA